MRSRNLPSRPTGHCFSTCCCSQAAESSGFGGVAAAKKAAGALTKMALERGTRDNVTVLVVDLRSNAGSRGKYALR